MTTQIAQGDVVRLKSGGPAMTVAQVGEYLGVATAWCEWFDEKHQPKKETFSVAVLEKYTPQTQVRRPLRPSFG